MYILWKFRAAIQAWLTRRDSGFFFFSWKNFENFLISLPFLPRFAGYQLRGIYTSAQIDAKLRLKNFLRNFRISAKIPPSRWLPIERENKSLEIFSKTLPFLPCFVGYQLREYHFGSDWCEVDLRSFDISKVHRVTAREPPGAERKGGKLLLSRSGFRVKNGIENWYRRQP